MNKEIKKIILYLLAIIVIAFCVVYYNELNGTKATEIAYYM